MPYHFKKWYYQQEGRSALILYQICKTQALLRELPMPLLHKK